MKIAVTYADGLVFQHFGHTPAFKIYEVQAGEIVNEEVVDTTGSGHGALATMLSQQEVNLLICGGIRGGARVALAEAGIVIMGGVAGDADDAVDTFLAGALRFDPNAACHHHDHGEGHTCGDHGCGSHCGGHCGGHE